MPVGPLHEQHYLSIRVSGPFGLQVSGAKRQVDGGLSSQSSTGLEKPSVRRPGPLRPLAVDEEVMEGRPAVGEFRKANLPEALTSRSLLPTGDATATAHHGLARNRGPQRDSRVGRADLQCLLQFIAPALQQQGDRLVRIGHTRRCGRHQRIWQGSERVMRRAITPDIGVRSDHQEGRRQGQNPSRERRQKGNPTHVGVRRFSPCAAFERI